VVVESPRGCTSKIKYDDELEAFTLSRPLLVAKSQIKRRGRSR